MATQLVLSGTLSCPNCAPGKFQPGLSLGDSTCLCVGQYTITASMDCRNVGGSFVCTQSSKTTLVLGKQATCKCAGKPTALTSAPACNCGKTICVPVKKVSKTQS